MAKTKRNGTSEDRMLEEAFQQIAGRKTVTAEESRRSNSLTVVICIALAAIIVCLGAIFFYLVQREMNRVILSNVTIAGIPLQGMTQAEAFDAVESNYKPQGLTVTVLEHSVHLPPNCIDGLNIRKAVRAACNLESTADMHSLDLAPYLNVNEKLTRNYLAELGNYYNTTLQQSTYQVLGQAPEQVLQVSLGTPEYGLDMEQLYLDVLAAYGKNQTKLEGHCTLLVPQQIDLKAIYEAYCHPAVDAAYDLTTHRITAEADGYGFDLETTQKMIDTAKYGETLKVPFAVITPSVTREDVEASLYKDILGTFTAKSSSQKNRDTNLRLACESINGIILYPGDEFSYNRTLGERTPEKGYRPAGTYVGNETVNTYGGGICQVSSSLYYSVLSAELHVTERTNHRFLPSYMPRGFDATVSWGTLDFCFKNNLDYPIRIEASAKGGTTTVTICGTDVRNYRVQLAATVVEKTPYATEYKEMPQNNKEGYKDGDYIVKPHSGYFVKSYIYKYEMDSDKLISKEYIDDSNYRIRNAVVCKIIPSSDDDNNSESTTDSPGDPPSSSETTPSIQMP